MLQEGTHLVEEQRFTINEMQVTHGLVQYVILVVSLARRELFHRPTCSHDLPSNSSSTNRVFIGPNGRVLIIKKKQQIYHENSVIVQGLYNNKNFATDFYDMTTVIIFSGFDTRC
jgi:hypothetical protein